MTKKESELLKAARDKLSVDLAWRGITHRPAAYVVLERDQADIVLRAVQTVLEADELHRDKK